MPAAIVTATVQATTLACMSNILAQLLNAYRKDLPLSLSLPDFLRFLIVTVITAPPNYLWQGWLERTFPGRKLARDADISLAERGQGRQERLAVHHGRSVSNGTVLSPIREKTEHEDDRWRSGSDPNLDAETLILDKKNTAIKWFIDCITIGALLNTTAFLIIMGVLKGKDTGRIGRDIHKQTLPIIFAGYRIWPIASVISFSLIPVEKRIVFLSAVGLLWGIYMSLVGADL